MGCVRRFLFWNLFFIALIPMAHVHAVERRLITENLELGCGISDNFYDYLALHLTERSKLNLPLRSKGSESGRRLYVFADNSWFLTLEFLSSRSVADDITCVVAKGSEKDIESAFEVEVAEYPQWRWGRRPLEWP